MDGSDDDAQSTQKGEAPAQQESGTARAEAAIRAIAAGADPGAEALRLSNRFTDELTSRVSRMFGRRRHDGGSRRTE